MRPHADVASTSRRIGTYRRCPIDPDYHGARRALRAFGLHASTYMEGLLSEAAGQQLGVVLVRIVETAGALIIFPGAVIGSVRFVYRAVRVRRAEAFVQIRLDLGRFLALGLEFQLASDLLRTAVAPSFAEIGKLAAIAAIRTGLNFFLAREIRDERAELEERDEHLA